MGTLSDLATYETCGWIPALPMACCVVLSPRLPPPSETQFPIRQFVGAQLLTRPGRTRLESEVLESQGSSLGASGLGLQGGGWGQGLGHGGPQWLLPSI